MDDLAELLEDHGCGDGRRAVGSRAAGGRRSSWTCTSCLAASTVSGAVFDAGALIAFEKGVRRVVAVVVRALGRRVEITTVPAGVVGQVWRDGRRQVRPVRLLGSDVVSVESLDDTRARAAGQLCAVRHTKDVIDASVVLCARAHGTAIVTSDPQDLARLDPAASLIVV
jgi:hypothetical protein